MTLKICDSEGKRKRHIVFVKRYYRKNAEKIKEYQKHYREKNKELLKEKRRAYTHKKMKSITLYLKKRDELKKGLKADLTDEQWETIKKIFKGKCVYCGKKTMKLTQDHVIPLTLGGSLTLQNIVPACRVCNSRKGNRLPKDPIKLILI